MTLESASSLKDKITTILESHADARDDDVTLYAYYLWKSGVNVQTLRATDLFTMIRRRHVSSMDTVSRARRWVQDKYPATRGMKYRDRHTKEEEVRQDITTDWTLF